MRDADLGAWAHQNDGGGTAEVASTSRLDVLRVLTGSHLRHHSGIYRCRKVHLGSYDRQSSFDLLPLMPTLLQLINQ
jgi:hypothetical protein